MNIQVWRDKAAILYGRPAYPVLSLVVDVEASPIKILRYLVHKNEDTLPYSFDTKDRAEMFFDSVRKLV